MPLFSDNRTADRHVEQIASGHPTGVSGFKAIVFRQQTPVRDFQVIVSAPPAPVRNFQSIVFSHPTPGRDSQAVGNKFRLGNTCPGRGLL
jgi:hypothetical protein